jgi:polyferredoxin
MVKAKTRIARYGIMAVILGLVTYMALGNSTRSFEAYCPFGGAESLWGLFVDGEFSCALGPLNLSLTLAVIGLVVVSKKSFCGWACPIGFLGELTGRLGGVIWKKRPVVPRKTNAYAKLWRYAVLAVSLFFTYKLGELVLRGYDPFYLIFSGFGHGSAGLISFAVMGIIIVGAFIVPMFFCRYLCPLGAVFDPFGRLGLIKVTRDEASCTSCGACSKACPHGIPVQELRAVRHRDCTNCLECLDACPDKRTLEIKATI